MFKTVLASIALCVCSFTCNAEYSYGFKTEYNYSQHYGNPGYSSSNLNSSGMGSTMSRMQEDSKSDTSYSTYHPMTEEEKTLTKWLFSLIGLVLVVTFGSLFFINRR